MAQEPLTYCAACFCEGSQRKMAAATQTAAVRSGVCGAVVTHRRKIISGPALRHPGLSRPAHLQLAAGHHRHARLGCRASSTSGRAWLSGYEAAAPHTYVARVDAGRAMCAADAFCGAIIRRRVRCAPEAGPVLHQSTSCRGLPSALHVPLTTRERGLAPRRELLLRQHLSCGCF